MLNKQLQGTQRHNGVTPTIRDRIRKPSEQFFFTPIINIDE